MIKGKLFLAFQSRLMAVKTSIFFLRLLLQILSADPLNGSSDEFSESLGVLIVGGYRYIKHVLYYNYCAVSIRLELSSLSSW